MALYKIGVTEAGDAGVDLSWEEKLDDVDAAVLITKCVSPDFFDATLRHKDKLIIHTTVTGYGHSILEPNVPTLYEEFTAIMELVKAGFPMSRIVVRVDPIIPTEKGLSVAYHTLTSFMEMGFQRYRVSVIDMYPHARSRFKKAGLPLPYGDSGFAHRTCPDNIQGQIQPLAGYRYARDVHSVPHRGYDRASVVSCAVRSGGVTVGIDNARAVCYNNSR